MKLTYYGGDYVNVVSTNDDYKEITTFKRIEEIEREYGTAVIEVLNNKSECTVYNPYTMRYGSID